jgi:UDP-N-acetylmuramate dehydrogenase
MIEELRRLISPAVRENEPLAPMTTFRIGGPAQFFLEATSAEEAVQAQAACRQLNLPIYFIGGGSNLLISDEGIKGLVVRMSNQGTVIDGDAVTVGSGTPSGRLAMETAKAGLGGLEWMVGLPGTVGGAVRGNAGMFGTEVKDNLESVLALTPEAETKTMTSQDCGFGYRDSAFKRLPGTVILSARFRLRPCPPVEAQDRMRQFLERKVKSQPVAGHTAGCVFKNWLPKSEEEIETVRKCLDLNREEAVPRTAAGAVSAGWIIDRAQLKGMAVGHCRVSDQHANFILNDGQGTASEVIALTAAVKMKVRDMTKGIVMLEDEIEYAGF